MEKEKGRPLIHVNIGLFADDVGETATNTLDRGHGEHNLLLSINVRVLHTQNVLEIFVCNERLQLENRKQLVVNQKD